MIRNLIVAIIVLATLASCVVVPLGGRHYRGHGHGHGHGHGKHHGGHHGGHHYDRGHDGGSDYRR
ncbi:MAG: hypothetical protein FJY37_15380 [Betaproteobacteria bacterium]|nr:hypothetical protein [Betaproteobacteria bacterium]